jgi:hypothetical protein
MYFTCSFTVNEYSLYEANTNTLGVLILSKFSLGLKGRVTFWILDY